MSIDRQILRASWRRWWSFDAPRAGPAWLQLAWTSLFVVVIAALFTVLGSLAFGRTDPGWRMGSQWLEWYGRNLIIAGLIGFTIHGLFALSLAVLGEARIRRLQGWRRSVFYASVPMLGVVIGWPPGFIIAGGNLQWVLRQNAQTFGLTAGVALLISLAFHVLFAIRSRQIAAQMDATEARLRLLQAQIEPHFLFNTLAQVSALIEQDPGLARHTLETFTDHLRATLASLRRSECALDDELLQATHFLQLMQARMEDRLRFVIDADASVRLAAVPTLLLQPLVENAVVHGLEPTIPGGSVWIHATRHDDRLVIEVRDDGQGLEAGARRPRRPGTGLALENLRERLAHRHAGQATLQVEDAHPGTRVRITLPFVPYVAPGSAPLRRDSPPPAFRP